MIVRSTRMERRMTMTKVRQRLTAAAAVTSFTPPTLATRRVTAEPPPLCWKGDLAFEFLSVICLSVCSLSGGGCLLFQSSWLSVLSVELVGWFFQWSWLSVLSVVLVVCFSGVCCLFFQWCWLSVLVELVVCFFSGVGCPLFQWSWLSALSLELVVCFFSGIICLFFQLSLLFFQWSWLCSFSGVGCLFFQRSFSGVGCLFFPWSGLSALSVELVVYSFSGCGGIEW